MNKNHFSRQGIDNHFIINPLTGKVSLEHSFFYGYKFPDGKIGPLPAYSIGGYLSTPPSKWKTSNFSAYCRTT